MTTKNTYIEAASNGNLGAHIIHDATCYTHDEEGYVVAITDGPTVLQSKWFTDEDVALEEFDMVTEEVMNLYEEAGVDFSEMNIVNEVV